MRFRRIGWARALFLLGLMSDESYRAELARERERADAERDEEIERLRSRIAQLEAVVLVYEGLFGALDRRLRLAMPSEPGDWEIPFPRVSLEIIRDEFDKIRGARRIAEKIGRSA